MKIGDPGDALEQEADQIAEKVMRMRAGELSIGPSAPQLSRAGVACKKDGAHELQTRGEAPSIVHEVLHSPGQPLDAAVLAFMGPRFGFDFSQVQIHTNAQAADSAAAVKARAYTVGNHIVFNGHEHAPETPSGLRLLAHELAHVVQQASGGPQIQRFASCSVVTMSGEIGPPRVSGETERARHDPFVVRFIPEPEHGQLVANFAVGSSRIKPGLASNPYWDAFVREVEAHPEARWEVLGFTDCSGSEALNDALREARAQALLGFMPSAARAQIDVARAAPMFDCIADNSTEPNRALNRSAFVRRISTAIEFEEEVVQGDRPGDAMRRCQDGKVGEIKTFPFRATRFGGAPISARREGEYIVVKQPSNSVGANEDFREQTRTLPPETFLGGVRLRPDEVVRIHIYEPPWYKINITGFTGGDEETEFCVTGEQMLEISDKSTTGTLLNIGLTALDVATLFVPVGKLVQPVAKAGRSGLFALLVGTAEAAPPLRGVASQSAITLVEEQITTRVAGRAVNQTVSHTVIQTAERGIAESTTQAAAAVPRVVSTVSGSIASTGTNITLGAGLEVAGGAVRSVVTPSGIAVQPPIEGAGEIVLSQAEYDAALSQVFPSQYVDVVARNVDGIGQRAASRALQNPRFVEAIQDGNWTLAGTLFHSAAAREARALPATALPAGWTIQAELVIQAGRGGSRADLLLRGPAGQLIEFDWKTTGRSALSTGARRELERHAGQIRVNLGGTLTIQESRSWIDFVRPYLPNINWP